ncbi:putative polysaccharide biosynthesis protein [Marininema mesophilum]|uniref:putative polysaccharide biosynthesis protein n=1 Tax=Marininema mesophilum TaxID=1048340 RepID=UPI001FE1C16B|nr:polysaccharide biosynthesis protein [Marininema mesophilum]
MVQKGEPTSLVKQSLLKGVAILGIATFITKLLGAVYKIPYQNITGNQGLFVYQQVYPLYSTLLTLATAGVPIAISKLVSERLAEGDEYGAQRIFRISSFLLSSSGILFFFLVYFGAPWIATWMGSAKLLTLPIQAVSFALLVVPLMSVIRGFFQGHQNMIPTAVSQVVEQAVRVMTILILSWWLMKTGAGVVWAGTGAVFGAFTGAVAGLIILLFYWRQNRREWKKHSRIAKTTPSSFLDSTRKVIRTLFILAVPVCLGALVMPLFSLVDSFTVTNLLIVAGWKTEAAVDAKGIFDRGQPLIQFASFFATALSLSIVPAVAEARAKGDERGVVERSVLALRLTLLFGIPASLGLAVVAGATNIMLFRDDSGTSALAILAFTTLFSTLGLTSSGILQGLGQVGLPARNLLIGVGVKLFLNAWWVPTMDIDGAAWATVVGYAVASLLNLAALRGQIGSLFRLRGRGFSILGATVLMGLSARVVMGLVSVAVAGSLSLRLGMTLATLSAVLIGAVAYILALFRFGGLTQVELERVPKAGPELVRLLKRLRVLPS